MRTQPLTNISGRQLHTARLIGDKNVWEATVRRAMRLVSRFASRYVILKWRPDCTVDGQELTGRMSEVDVSSLSLSGHASMQACTRAALTNCLDELVQLSTRANGVHVSSRRLHTCRPFARCASQKTPLGVQ